MTCTILSPDLKESVPIPLFTGPVEAGFPSPADDHVEQTLDLNQYLIARPASTYFVRVEGESMTGAGIHSGDLLIVDRSLHPKSGHIVIVFLNGEFTVKRLKKLGSALYLEPAHPKYPVVRIEPEWDFQIWGVVTYCIHSCSS